LIEWSSSVIVVDMPPGTSDEHLSTFDVLKGNNLKYSVLIVTSPSLLSIADVRKGINLCKTVGARIEGIIENFCGVMCPCCGKVTPLVEDTDMNELVSDTGLEILARIPFLPVAAAAADIGQRCDLILPFFDVAAERVVAL
jgi:ATP-binding protein involved in chromosome partitioning